MSRKPMSRKEIKAFLERSIANEFNFTRVNIYSPRLGGEDDQFIHGVRSMGFSDNKLFIGAGYHEGAEIALNDIKALDIMCLDGGVLLHIFRRF